MIVRSILRPLAGIWLACQVAAFALTPVAICCAPADANAAVPECCQNVKPGQECPMHHRTEGSPSCRMCGTGHRSDLALLSLSGGLGIVPRTLVLTHAPAPAVVVTAAVPQSLSRADRPEAPPPRS